MDVLQRQVTDLQHQLHALSGQLSVLSKVTQSLLAKRLITTVELAGRFHMLN